MGKKTFLSPNLKFLRCRLCEAPFPRRQTAKSRCKAPFPRRYNSPLAKRLLP